MPKYNYITKDGAIYDQKLLQGSVTADLETPDVKLVQGGKSFTLTTISTSGYKAHTRGKGYNEGELKNDKKVYTMGQDRDVEFFVDKEDVDETNGDLEAARVSKEFIDSQATPELDAYRFSALVTKTKELKPENITEDTIDESNVYTTLKKAILPVRKFGPQNVIIYVSSVVMDALERSKEFTRSITNQNVGQTALESRITSIDGMVIKEVWADERFYDKFDFTDGFAPAADAKHINFLIVAKPAVIAVAKTNSIYFFAPGEHTQGDGYLYQNRLYHDLWVKEQQVDGVRASLSK